LGGKTPVKAKAQAQKWGRAFRWQYESDTSGRRVGRKEDWEGEPQTAARSIKVSGRTMKSPRAKDAHQSFPASRRNGPELVSPPGSVIGSEQHMGSLASVQIQWWVQRGQPP